MWVIDGQSTGVQATGKDGKDGKDGTNGKDGVSPTLTIEDGMWVINGQSTGVKATGEDGKDGKDGYVLPVMEVNDDGYMIINGEVSQINVYDGSLLTETEYKLQKATIGSFPMPNSKARGKITFAVRMRKGTVVRFLGDTNTYSWAVVETFDTSVTTAGTFLDSGWHTTWHDYDGTYTSKLDGGYLVLTLKGPSDFTSLTGSFHSLFEITGHKMREVTVTQVENAQSQADYAVNSVAHRGYSFEAPENTLSAFRLAAQKGFGKVECDVSFTSDGYPVILHDATIDRTSNGTGAINELTLEQVRSYDFGSWKSATYAGEKIPTFEEFIVLCKNLGLHPYIEIKSGATSEQAAGLMETVIRYGMKDKVTWISFDSAALTAVVGKYAKARVGFIVNTIDQTAVTTALSLDTGKNEVFIDAYYKNVNSDAVNLCVSNLLPLEVWTVDDENAVLALDPYVSGVTSNHLVASKVLKNA